MNIGVYSNESFFVLAEFIVIAPGVWSAVGVGFVPRYLTEQWSVHFSELSLIRLVIIVPDLFILVWTGKELCSLDRSVECTFEKGRYCLLRVIFWGIIIVPDLLILIWTGKGLCSLNRSVECAFEKSELCLIKLFT